MGSPTNLLEKWKNQHWQQVCREIKQAGLEFRLENIDKIVELTSFKVRSKKQEKLCPYYSKGIPCHPEIDNFNCLLCACPNYDVSKLTGACKTNSISGKWHYHQNLPEGKVWDCSNCSIGHTAYDAQVFLYKNLEWLRKMSETL